MHAMMDGDIRFYHQNRIILDQTLTKPFGVVQKDDDDDDMNMTEICIQPSWSCLQNLQSATSDSPALTPLGVQTTTRYKA